MSINWGSIAKVGLTIAGTVIPQVNTVEQLAKTIQGLRGTAKEDVAVTLVKNVLESGEQVAGRELLNDPAVETATRSFIQAYVALQDVIATRKQPGPVTATAPAAK